LIALGENNADPHRTYVPFGGSRKAWYSRANVLGVHGPTRTGKTRGILEKIVARALKYPGSRHAIGRKYRASMTATILQTMDNDVLPPGHPAKRGAGAANRLVYEFPNGSTIWVFGLDTPERIMGSEYDTIAVFECTEPGLTEYDVLQILPTRLSHNVCPYRQLILDMNPTSPAHWARVAMLQGRIEDIPSRLNENPKFYDVVTGEPNALGREYIDRIRSTLTGVDFQRKVEGHWVADERAIFDTAALIEHRTLYCVDPIYTGTLDFGGLEGTALDRELRQKRPDGIRFRGIRAGGAELVPWKLWCPLVRDSEGRLRPPQDDVYVLAADVSWGQGASNSVITVFSRNLRKKVAEFASGAFAPEAFARILVAAGYWFGGFRGEGKACGMLGWEVNGPGEGLGKIICALLEYPWVYMTMNARTGRDQATENVGWRSDRPGKILLASGLNDAYRNKTVIDPSSASIDEASNWVRYLNGGIGPSHLQEESADAHATHGDRTVATMLGLTMLDHAPIIKPRERPAPHGSRAAEERQAAAEALRLELGGADDEDPEAIL
jgi:hypothetical protein